MMNLPSFRPLLPLVLLGWLVDSHAFAENTGPSPGGWQRALPGASYQFPRDHEIHPGYKTEWWYFTGTLRGTNQHEYGYELTFFRQGALPPERQATEAAEPASQRSRFVQNDFKFAHFAISDLDGRRFYFTQKISRGAFGEAGFGQPFSLPTRDASNPQNTTLAWIEDWSLQPQADGTWKISARAKEPAPMQLDLVLTPAKPPVIEGTEGVSQKAAGDGNASYYYSYTRLKSDGILAVGASAAQPVHGESWFDHEWASNQLAGDQVGWDWFCLQFEDHTELMLYAMRRRDGTVDPVSSGTWVDADGHVEHLRYGEFKLRSTRTWHSAKTSATYPLGWQVSVPKYQLELTLEPRLDDQELVLPPVSYWEGAIQASGQRGAEPTKAHGYMELTGYAGELKGLQGPAGTAGQKLRETPR